MDTLKQPLITVVVPNYNGHRFVEHAVDSVLVQDPIEKVMQRKNGGTPTERF